jgi:hypothetical protein
MVVYLADGSISNQSDAYDKALMWTWLEFVTRTVREKLVTVKFVFEEDSEDAPGAEKKTRRRGSTESDATDSSMPDPSRQGQDRNAWRVLQRSCHGRVTSYRVLLLSSAQPVSCTSRCRTKPTR